jgi:hypothetical protein
MQKLKSKTKKRKLEKPLKLDMSFDEALKRTINKQKSKNKKT